MSEPAYERRRSVGAGAAVVLQANPSVMTLEGTNTWLLRGSSDGPAVLVDPGQRDDADGDAHLDAVLAAAPDIALVLVTHGHHDHSGLSAALHERSGAPVRAAAAAYCAGAEPLADGEIVDAAGVRLRVLATPGHTADSLCFVLEDAGAPVAVLTGDTVLGRGTTVVAHPDGNLRDYLASLQRLRELGALAVWPGHGPELPDIAAVASEYLAHRAQRLDQVRAALERLGPDATPRQVVEIVYADVDESVWFAADWSVAAQLDYLRAGDPG